MHWYWWVLIGIAGFIVASTVFLFIYLRFFADPGSLMLKKNRISRVFGQEVRPGLGDRILIILFWPELWLLQKILDKLFEDV